MKSRLPSANGDNGQWRDAHGRFSAGNPGGPGNPFAKRTAELRAAGLAAVEPDDLTRVVRAMLRAAEDSDVAAAKVLLA